MFLNLMIFNYDMILLMVFILFMVCESVLGLILLISMVRSLGNNNFQSLKLLKF